MKLAFNLPINTVSFGQVSTMLLRTLHEREQAGDNNLDIFVFPIGGGADLSSQHIDESFKTWLTAKINKSYESYNRDIPVFKLWHFNGSLESFGRKQTLLTFYELDNPTRIEQNIARNNKTCFSSKYACDVFKLFGVDTEFLPLAFDSYNFKKLEKEYHTDGRIIFNICGKFERRKHHAKAIQAWIKRFGNNPKYFLQCATYNTFFNEQQNNELIRQVVGQDKPYNVNFFPSMKENNVYNDFLNSADIILGMSGGEGWGLPEFHSVALGKHAVLMNAHAYKTWATPEMVSFVQPVGKITAVDNMFFRNGDVFNQGQIFDFNDDEFIAACELALKKVEAKKLNETGLTLQTIYSKELFVDNVIKISTASL
jgi:hypothetical protein